MINVLSIFIPKKSRLLCKLLLFILFSGLSSSFLIHAQEKQRLEGLDFVLLSSDKPWLVSLVTPVIAKIHEDSKSKIPGLVLKGDFSNPKNLAFLTKQKQALLLIEESDHLPLSWKNISQERFSSKKHPTTIGAFLAHRFWKKSDRLVIAFLDSPKDMIKGSLLAAYWKVPFIPIKKTESPLQIKRNQEKISRIISSLGTKEVFIADNDTEKISLYLGNTNFKRTILTSTELEKSLRQAAPSKIKNLIVTNILPQENNVQQTAWLAPYLALAHQGSIVYTETSNPKEAEKKVLSYIDQHKIFPRNITLLASYFNLGVITMNDPNILGEYEVEIEPCSYHESKAISWGVGRIASDNVEEASLLITRSLWRKGLLGKQKKQVLMVANDGGDLPFAETISRATAREFKNHRIAVDQYYENPSNMPSILKTADNAQLIIFEGHVNNQYIFPSEDDEEEILRMEDGDVYLPFLRYETETRDLKGLALVVLQSCHSLEEPTARSIFEAGGVGLVGSVTNIHSASGSAFIKAFCDNLLYRRCTVGEALRDARNYFLCLARLKLGREHSQIAKVMRVALSFRFWGDPELRLHLSSQKAPLRSPIKAKFTPQHNIRIHTPEKHLAKSKTEQYFTRMFPACSLAGIVKRLKKREDRRLMVFYFFRLKLPKDFRHFSEKDLRREQDPDFRSVYMLDYFERALYVLYFPKKDEAKDSILLKFTRNKPSEK